MSIAHRLSTSCLQKQAPGDLEVGDFTGEDEISREVRGKGVVEQRGRRWAKRRRRRKQRRNRGGHSIYSFVWRFTFTWLFDAPLSLLTLLTTFISVYWYSLWDVILPSEIEVGDMIREKCKDFVSCDRRFIYACIGQTIFSAEPIFTLLGEMYLRLAIPRQLCKRSVTRICF